ncbi:MAG: Gfo/Idh/MocA family oxidoreductase [Planctomycetaceae bacterium]|nr:Gfo/Idh/MocA family oxidoreductase [Planctomycetaceae bacterium]
MTGAVRFGLVGYGLFGAHHAHAIQATPGAQLVAIAARSEASRISAATAHPQTTVHADYRELLDRRDIDAVSIVVPNALHYEVAAAALASGKHVLLEKPMALSVAHCQELIGLAADHGRLLAIGHELRLSSLWGSVKRLIDEGAIGLPRFVLVELSRFPYRQGSGGWRYDLAQVGSWILEEPIHFFDLARWYLAGSGEPVSIFARANSRLAGQHSLADNFAATVDFHGGAFAVIVQTLAAFDHHQTAKIAGEKGTIWAAWSGVDARTDRPTFSLRYGLAADVHEVPLAKPAGELLELADEIAAFVRSIQAGTPLPCTGTDGLWSTHLCLAAQESIERGAIVELAPG